MEGRVYGVEVGAGHEPHERGWSCLKEYPLLIWQLSPRVRRNPSGIKPSGRARGRENQSERDRWLGAWSRLVRRGVLADRGCERKTVFFYPADPTAPRKIYPTSGCPAYFSTASFSLLSANSCYAFKESFQALEKVLSSFAALSL